MDADVIAPRRAPRYGHDRPAAALVAAGGLPSSAPRTPLLVAVNDPDRATDTAPALRAVRAAAGGRPLRVVFATGSHRHSDEARAAHQARLLRAAGEPTTWHWHDAHDGDHVEVGPARVDRHLGEARDVVAIGSVEPHWFAGLTGAHKTLTVGLMAYEGIEENHRHALEPGARPLQLAGNPVHEGLVRVLEALARERRLLALQHVGRQWLAGPPLPCLEACAVVAAVRWLSCVPTAYDYVVAVVEPPLDRTLYQAEKGVKHTEYAVRDGGAIVLDASCAQGVGPLRFVELLRRAPDESAARSIVRREGYRLGDHKAVRLRALQARGVQLALVSERLPDEFVRAAGFRVFPSEIEAAVALHDMFGSRARAAVVEDAAHMVVEVR